MNYIRGTLALLLYPATGDDKENVVSEETSLITRSCSNNRIIFARVILIVPPKNNFINDKNMSFNDQ